MSFTVHGLPVSQGIAIGRVHLVSHALLEVNHYHIAPRHLEDELARLDEAVAMVEGELVGLKTATSSAPHGEVGAFIDLQRMMLTDPILVAAARAHIETRRCNAEWALVQQMEAVVEQFRQIEDPYLRERQADVVQVVERLVKALLGQPGHLPPRRKDGVGTVVVAHDLSPADTIGFRDHNIAGFVTDVGGPTSHTAIVARNLGIPAVVGLYHIRDLVEDNELVIVDGTRGVIIVSPDENIVEEYQLRRSTLELERTKLKRLRDTPATTLDGSSIQLLANIDGPKDVAQLREINADGIGLYRTEFLFIGRDMLPDEDEQFEAYRMVLKTVGGKPVTIRTFDVGSDKALNGARSEPNPALGLRAVRYSLAEPKIFLTQLRALLRASVYGKLQIMVPMLAHVDEIDQTLTLIAKAKEELSEERIKFDENLPVGGMIEVPAAALALGMLIPRLSFLSIGTNDLIQYTLAIDRSNEAVVHLYDPLHPAVLRLIAITLQAGAKAELPVSVCGEMA
ncbi:MAG: phosphoenolpyruvate--protein phosphotransferase, partial [Azoarcus sp.]|nr:phosphoenolpyruvate--protein phosphotransferase [Azoarcus sp.]